MKTDRRRFLLAAGALAVLAASPARASSINRRIRRIASARPTKIASPIRKWPMLSSATCGMAAMGFTVS